VDAAARGYPPGDFRVSDADRDRALAELTEACRVGRITDDEFDERSALVLRARTGEELTAPLADLPPAPVPVARPPDVDWASRHVANRVVIGGSIGAACFAAAAIRNCFSNGPTPNQQHQMQEAMARYGFPVPRGAAVNPGFDLIGVLAPAAVALVFVLVVLVALRRARASRPG
jgi:hypothetical protein